MLKADRNPFVSRPPRVLVTRSSRQASQLAAQLRAAGAEPILVPAIELAEPTSNAALDQALARLEAFDWLLFTSANAVEFFARRLALVRTGLPSGPKVAAIGAATARALEAVGLRADLIPPQAVAESLAEALLPHARRPDGSPSHLLLLRAEVAREVLPHTLRSAGAELTIAPVYRNIVPASSIAAMGEIFSSRAHWPDAITFTSSSTATNLLALLETANLCLSQEILRVSIGPITSQTLCDLGLPPHAEAAEPNLTSLVAAVMDKWKQQEQVRDFDEKQSLGH
jgi:uroporphyrinogen-III synthase